MAPFNLRQSSLNNSGRRVVEQNHVRALRPPRPASRYVFSSCPGQLLPTQWPATVCQARSYPFEEQPGNNGRHEDKRIRNANSWDFSAKHDNITPPPSNTAAQEDEILYFPTRRGMWTFTDRPGVDMAKLSSVSHLQQVYVILFGVGQKDTEGIYSLRAFNDDGLPQETIIVFEAEDDAARYAGLLEATMEHIPAVCSIPPAELLEFCQESGYHCRLEPTGSLLIPPEFNVGITDWERSMRLREGRFAVLEAEPDHASPKHSGNSGKTTTRQAVQAAPHPLATMPARHSEGAPRGALAKYRDDFSVDELAEIRVMLESLLPSNDNDDPQNPSSGGSRSTTSTDSWEDEHGPTGKRPW